ncbi:MAG: hypothetical protein KDA84_19585, partial [Planctomycetaceae bacterium]|nr:hypothetical protein [Planctomycetaceae bacterium]
NRKTMFEELTSRHAFDDIDAIFRKAPLKNPTPRETFLRNQIQPANRENGKTLLHVPCETKEQTDSLLGMSLPGKNSIGC